MLQKIASEWEKIEKDAELKIKTLPVSRYLAKLNISCEPDILFIHVNKELT